MFSLWADYNASFADSPWIMLNESCQRDMRTPYVSIETLNRLTIKGYETIKCVTREKDGTLHVSVAIQAGKWVNPGNNPDLRVATVMYRATMITYPKQVEKDLTVFKAFLNSIEIDPPDM